MKKFLFIIIFSLICIIPFNVSAIELEDSYIWISSGLTDEQKQEYIDKVKNSSYFKENVNLYPYYTIVYHKGSYYPFNINYTNRISLRFYNEIPTFNTSNSTRITIPSSSASLEYQFYVDGDRVMTQSLGFLCITNYTNSGHEFLGDFFLESNFELSLGAEVNLVNENGDYLQTLPADYNLFSVYEKVEYTIEDILNSDDSLYLLSRELIGPLPEEFSFIYSIVSLMLGILVLLVIISPFVLLKRWLM